MPIATRFARPRAAACLDERIDALPGGYDCVCGATCGCPAELQRLAIARAAVAGAAAAARRTGSALDPQTGRALRNMLRGDMRTRVIVSHDLDAVRHADQIRDGSRPHRRAARMRRCWPRAGCMRGWAARTVPRARRPHDDEVAQTFACLLAETRRALARRRGWAVAAALLDGACGLLLVPLIRAWFAGAQAAAALDDRARRADAGVTPSCCTSHNAAAIARAARSRPVSSERLVRHLPRIASWQAVRDSHPAGRCAGR